MMTFDKEKRLAANQKAREYKAAIARGERSFGVPVPAETGGFRSFGEFLLAVRSEFLGGTRDRRLLDEIQRRGTPAGASEQIPADGGFIVPQQFSQRIIQRMYLTGELISRCFQMPITVGNSVSYPQFDETSRANGSRFGGVQAYFDNESDRAVATKPRFGRATLTAKKLIGLVYLTDELWTDVNALEIFGSAAFSTELGFRLEDAIVNGDGAGRPSGILSSGALVTVPKQANQIAGTIVGQNIVDMWARCWAPSRHSSVFLAHPDAEAQCITASVPVGTAGSELPLYKPTEDPENQPFNTLLGRPIIPCEYMQVPGTVGDLLLVDLNRYCLAMREVNQAVSMHVSFLTDEMAYRVTLRVDGQSIDARPITPFTGPNQISSFVALAAR